MGVAYSFVNESWPPKPRFSTSDVPDLRGKVVIVTGGNAGVGYETVKVLLEHNAKVYLAARDARKVAAAVDRLKEATGKEPIFLKLDLSDLSSVKHAADEFNSKESDLHILFNNAGVMAPPLEQTTAAGYDLQFGTNVLGHFYFTKLVLPTLLSAAKSSSDRRARVVYTSSLGHISASLDPRTYKDGPARRKKSTEWLYTQSKLGVVVVAKEMGRRYGDQGIVCTSLNPGNLRTELQRHWNAKLDFVRKSMLNAMLHPQEFGALTPLYAGTSPETRDANGKYFIPWAREGNSLPMASDPKVGGQLWGWLEEQVEDFERTLSHT